MRHQCFLLWTVILIWVDLDLFEVALFWELCDYISVLESDHFYTAKIYIYFIWLYIESIIYSINKLICIINSWTWRSQWHNSTRILHFSYVSLGSPVLIWLSSRRFISDELWILSCSQLSYGIALGLDHAKVWDDPSFQQVSVFSYSTGNGDSCMRFWLGLLMNWNHSLWCWILCPCKDLQASFGSMEGYRNGQLWTHPRIFTK